MYGSKYVVVVNHSTREHSFGQNKNFHEIRLSDFERCVCVFICGGGRGGRVLVCDNNRLKWGGVGQSN